MTGSRLAAADGESISLDTRRRLFRAAGDSSALSAGNRVRAGAKHIAGGFDNAVSLVGIPPKNRYVVIQFDSMDALQKWRQGPAGAFVRECLKKYGNAGWRLIAANGVQE